MTPDGPKWGQEDFFPTNPDLADILGRTDFDLENFYFFDFFGLPAWAQLGPVLGPAWAQLGCPCPDAAGAVGAAGRTLRSQPDPSPNAPRDQIRRKDPCCDKTLLMLKKHGKVPRVCNTCRKNLATVPEVH